jgi:hypothetical protein
VGRRGPRDAGVRGLGPALLVAACLLGSTGAAGPSPRQAPGGTPASSGAITVPAERELLTTSAENPVSHDTETMAIVAHAGRLFAATDQWEYSGPSPAGQVLVKHSRTSPWAVFEQTQSLRVEVLDSFTIPPRQGLGAGHSVLVTQAIVQGRAEIQWLVDGADAFAPANAFALSSNGDDVRAFGAHESGGAWAVYAGVAPTGILRGVWSPTRHTLVFDPTPELTAAASGAPGLRTQKVTGFADCAGALYVSIGTNIYRRNDRALGPGTPRWALVYQNPPVGAFNSGTRGLSCVRHDGSPSLLFSTEGNGDVLRLDHLPRGQVAAEATLGHPAAGLVSTLEFSPIAGLRQMLAGQGLAVPAAGPGSIGYVIAAYNNVTTMRIDGAVRQLVGLEWSYRPCPATRACTPGGFDAAACFAIRTDRGPTPVYTLRCLGGPELTPSPHPNSPVRSGQAFVSIRTIEASPFRDDRIYFGGYDCDFAPADGTAWIATAARTTLHPDAPLKAVTS